MRRKITNNLLRAVLLIAGAISFSEVGAFEPYAELSATSTNIVITESARVSLSVYLPHHTVKELGDENPPFMVRRPPHVTAPFIADEWTSGAIEKGDVNEMLQGERQSAVGFTLNNFASDPFESMMGRNPFESMFDRDPFESFGSRRKVFPVEAVREKIDSTNVWRFVMTFPSFKAVSPGKVKLDGVRVSVPLIDKLTRDKYGRARVVLKEINLVAKPLEIDIVEPPVEDRPKSYCGAIGSNVTVKASLDTNVCTAGDPMILTLDVEGAANPSAVFAPRFANLATNEFFRLDESSLKTDTLSSMRRFTWRMRVLKAGTVEFPSLEVAVYDLSERRYNALNTLPMPVQVKAGAQIALQVEEQLDGEIPFPLPDGIDLSEDGWKPLPLIPSIRIVLLLIFLPPPVFLLFRFLPRAIRSLNGRRKAKLSQNAFAVCKKVLLSRKDIKTKDRAVRRFLSVRYGINAASATALDAKLLMKNDFPCDDINLVVGALEEADSSRYSSKQSSKVLAIFIALALSLGSSSSVYAFDERVEFLWNRASSLAVGATEEKDFLRAAEAYGKCIHSGAENPKVYYNYGACLLMAGKAAKAYEAFLKVERYTGETPSTRRALRAAHSRLVNDPRSELSLMRIFFKPHFAYSFDARLLAFSIAWALIWIFAVLPKGGFKKFLIALTAVILTLSAVSVSLSLMVERFSEEVSDVQS
jgi:hypothetical protein